MPALPEWSVESHLELMDQRNIKKSILTVSSPGTHLVAGNHKLADELSRECNRYAADLKKRMPDRFGYFASLPIPEVETCLREIKLASEEGCDGFIMMTNGHGIYPGDSSLDPIFDELNRRQATLFFHPTTPFCPCSPEAIAAGQSPGPSRKQSAGCVVCMSNKKRWQWDYLSHSWNNPPRVYKFVS